MKHQTYLLTSLKLCHWPVRLERFSNYSHEHENYLIMEVDAGRH